VLCLRQLAGLAAAESVLWSEHRFYLVNQHMHDLFAVVFDPTVPYSGRMPGAEGASRRPFTGCRQQRQPSAAS
jgi:hypothetical protein